MDKQDVIDFFDRAAATWDAELMKRDEIIGAILDNAEVGEGMDILDVACGTGVMFEYYLARRAASVTGIDISLEMAKIAAGKFADEPRVQVICGDVEETVFDRKFDRIVVYNAFPHFPEPKRLIRTLAGLLKENGKLTIAHGASREAIDGHHKGSASKVSNGLMTADSLRKLFAGHLEVEVMISNSRMYQVSGSKGQPHVHSHGGLTHSHSQGEHHHHHEVAAADTPLEEVLALMKFLISHNDAHAQEVAELASQLTAAGRADSYDEIMDIVSDFDMVNARLAGVLNRLSTEVF